MRVRERRERREREREKRIERERRREGEIRLLRTKSACKSSARRAIPRILTKLTLIQILIMTISHLCDPGWDSKLIHVGYWR